MDKEIICNVSMFSLSTVCVLPTGEKIYLPHEDFINQARTLCNSEGIYTLHLFGNEGFINGLVEGSTIINNYGESAIEIKVN